jgi:chaperone required for assembly of F1-ATPase
MRKPLPKRFYKTVTHGAGPDGFHVLLDERIARTPKRNVLAVQQRALADVLVAEWAAQSDEINPASMPLTTLVCTARDAVTGNEPAVAAEIVNYAGSDLLCYRATTPDELLTAQSKAWDPVLEWSTRTLGAQFVVVSGLMHAAQPPSALAQVSAALQHMPALPLAAVHVLTTLTGSALLALAVARSGLTFDAAWTAAHVDEDWQIAKWGEDDEAVARRHRRHADANAAALVLSLHGTA